jgi:hypothetical protein
MAPTASSPPPGRAADRVGPDVKVGARQQE